MINESYFRLSDEDLKEINKKFKDTNLSFIKNYKNNINIRYTEIPNPNFSISYNNYSMGGGHANNYEKVHYILNKNINYRFIFSVCEKRLEQFESILKIMEERIIDDNFYIEDSKVSTIVELKKPKFDLKNSKHKINNRVFVNFEYNFHLPILSIIRKITDIEDAIKFFEQIWGYSENGEEISLLDYTIGDIISIKDDPTGDYIIIDYDYNKITNPAKYEIFYIFCEILNTKGNVIRYGNPYISDGSDFKTNRGDRLRTLLN